MAVPVRILIGPFWPSGLRFQRATLIDGEDRAALGPTTECLAIVDSAVLKVHWLRLPPASRAAADAWVLFETEPISDYNVALGMCAFRGKDASSAVVEGEGLLVWGAV